MTHEVSMIRETLLDIVESAFITSTAMTYCAVDALSRAESIDYCVTYNATSRQIASAYDLVRSAILSWPTDLYLNEVD